MTEDKNRAQQMVQDDAKRAARAFKEIGKQANIPVDVVSYESGKWPELENGGVGAFMPITIGVRGKLTKHEARIAGEMWRKATKYYPRARC